MSNTSKFAIVTIVMAAPLFGVLIWFLCHLPPRAKVDPHLVYANRFTADSSIAVRAININGTQFPATNLVVKSGQRYWLIFTSDGKISIQDGEQELPGFKPAP